MKGYKKTEIGIIPEDWEVKKLNDVIVKIIDNRGKTPPYTNKGIELIETVSINNVIKCPDYKKIEKFISNEVYNFWFRDYLEKYDLLISTVGEYAGSSAIMCSNRGIIAQNLIGLRIKKHSPIFIFYWTRSNLYLNQLNKVMMHQAQPSLKVPWLLEFKLLLPSLPEQKAIAKVLSDIDSLIENLDKLIQKKKLIKKGVMQELLTGKKRLPGFKSEWVRKKLGEIGQITGAGIDKKINKNEKTVRLLNYMDVYKKDFIYDKDINYWTTAPTNKIEQCSIKKGDIFFTPSSELQTDIAHSAVAMEDMEGIVYSYHIIRFRLKENWDLKFRTYIFKTKYFLNQAEKFAEGSGKRYVISLKKFRELEIYYPKDIEEQKAIAKILSDMDIEIESLERKKEKYEKIKKGAMELLLTGKVRLRKDND